MAVELLEKGEFGAVYNMGSEEAIKIYDLAKKLGPMMGWSLEIVIDPDHTRMRPWEIWYLKSDNTKLYNVIEARPNHTLTEALEITVAYFRDNDNSWGW